MLWPLSPRPQEASREAQRPRDVSDCSSALTPRSCPPPVALSSQHHSVQGQLRAFEICRPQCRRNHGEVTTRGSRTAGAGEGHLLPITARVGQGGSQSWADSGPKAAAPPTPPVTALASSSNTREAVQSHEVCSSQSPGELPAPPGKGRQCPQLSSICLRMNN